MKYANWITNVTTWTCMRVHDALRNPRKLARGLFFWEKSPSDRHDGLKIMSNGASQKVWTQTITYIVAVKSPCARVSACQSGPGGRGELYGIGISCESVGWAEKNPWIVWARDIHAGPWVTLGWALGFIIKYYLLKVFSSVHLARCWSTLIYPDPIVLRRHQLYTRYQMEN